MEDDKKLVQMLISKDVEIATLAMITLREYGKEYIIDFLDRVGDDNNHWEFGIAKRVLMGKFAASDVSVIVEGPDYYLYHISGLAILDKRFSIGGAVKVIPYEPDRTE